MAEILPFDDPITATEIAQHLRRMRELSGFTIPRAAERAGISTDTLALWEVGQNLVKFSRVLAQFESYGCVVKILPPRGVSRSAPTKHRGRR